MQPPRKHTSTARGTRKRGDSSERSGTNSEGFAPTKNEARSVVLAVGIPGEPQGHQVPDLLLHTTCPPAHVASWFPLFIFLHEKIINGKRCLEHGERCIGARLAPVTLGTWGGAGAPQGGSWGLGLGHPLCTATTFPWPCCGCRISRYETRRGSSAHKNIR